jgi:hypothetical protein
VKRLGDFIVGTLLMGPIVAVGLWFIVRDWFALKRKR